jgi:predicted esterase
MRFSFLLALALALVPIASRADDKPPTGRFRGDIVDPAKGDVIMRVALQAPKKPPERRTLTLLLLCHGYQGNENNYIGLTVEALQRLKLADEFVVLSGKSKGAGWTTDDDERMLRLIAWAKASYPIDSRRVFLFGSSNGAAFVGRFGSEHQDIFAGVVGYCGNYKFSPAIDKDGGAGRTEWYFVHGGKDNPQNSRKACDKLKEHGTHTIFRQMDGYGHTDIWDNKGHPDSKAADLVRDDWLRWVYSLRHKQMEPTEAEKKALVDLAEQIKTGKAEAVSLGLPRVIEIGGSPAAQVLLTGLRSDNKDIRAATAEALAYLAGGPETTRALLKALDDAGVEESRSTSLEGLSHAANWRDAEAQAGLINLSRDRKKPVALRARAVAALGKAAQLPLLGNLEDKGVIWSLVLLLDDDEEKVRAEALAALAPAVADAFAYKADLPVAERRAAIEKWKTWCKEKCGECPAELMR